MRIKAIIPKFDIANLKVKINTKNKSGRLEVGILGGKYPNGLNIAQNAKYQEFGTFNIPPRPFFRNAIKANKRKWVESYRKGLKARDLNAVERVGVLAASDVKASITNLKTPPNAPSTIQIKGSSNPLIDTGFLRSAIDYEVKK
ncbi:HK97-gp10 family putative phage morphogenesis protein [Helicobacter ganmani]|uniref:HK97-gp10 family putative phage morphogenesis protein n=1 Tax=Helicobacter ganmani TaxID=60246 RepID=UPI003A85AC84